MTFVSNNVVRELGLKPYNEASFKIDTLSGKVMTRAGLVMFNIQSLETEEFYCDVNAVINPPRKDDIKTLPYRQDLSCYSYFKDVRTLTLPECKTVDSLIGNDNAYLMWVPKSGPVVV